jgi:hypothetical protein
MKAVWKFRDDDGQTQFGWYGGNCIMWTTTGPSTLVEYFHSVHDEAVYPIPATTEKTLVAWS